MAGNPTPSAALNEAQEKVAATVQSEVLRFVPPPHSDIDQVLSKMLAQNVILALVKEGWL